MMLSIVIPSKNEELYIGKLLESIRQQTFRDFEVIVADNKSTDSTVRIAKRYGARVVKGGLPGPGRNRGAEVAKGEDILFLDSDVILPKRFLEKNYGEFRHNSFDIATTFTKPLSRKFIDKVIFKNINIGYRIIQKIKPGAQGFHIFVKRCWFKKVRGFDEKASFCEDYDFVLRVWNKGGKFGIMRGPPVKVSVRRLDKEGRFRYIAKGLYGVMHQQLIGPLYPGTMTYEFDAYKKRAHT